MPRPRARTLHKRVWNVGRILVLTGALCATFGAFFLTAAKVTSRAREVKVPDVRGVSVAQATEAIARVGLVLRVDPVRRADAKVPADHVLSQDPDPGSVLRRQRGVRVRVSDGQRAPDLPVVIGQGDRAAEITLTQSGVTIASRAEIRSTAFDPDTVVAQDPPGRSRASAVALLINRRAPDQSFVMPDLIGAAAARVTDLLRQRGFRVPSPTPVNYPNLPPGIVVRQTPQAGFQISAGETISLEVTR
jgi:serine/threonine-protein kinase